VLTTLRATPHRIGWSLTLLVVIWWLFVLVGVGDSWATLSAVYFTSAVWICVATFQLTRGGRWTRLAKAMLLAIGFSILEIVGGLLLAPVLILVAPVLAHRVRRHP
jgi:hypothetical protein